MKNQSPVQITHASHLYSLKSNQWVKYNTKAEKNCIIWLEYLPPVVSYLNPLCSFNSSWKVVEYEIPINFFVEFKESLSYIHIKRDEAIPPAAYLKAKKLLAIHDKVNLEILEETELEQALIYRNLRRLWRYARLPLSSLKNINIIEPFFDVDYLLTLGELKNLLYLFEYDPQLAYTMLFHRVLLIDLESYLLNDNLLIWPNFHRLEILKKRRR